MRTVGSVPFVNAKPLIAQFESLGQDSPVKVLFDLPSQLPAMLQSGVAEAILVSSVDAITTPGRKFVEGVCIGSRGPAESVRLFSKIPFDRVGTLALDQSSITSNALARVILAEKYGLQPSAELCPPDIDKMLRGHDAAVMIGDKGMMADGDGLNQLDLGTAWTELTGLPFVWALWTGNEGLSTELSGHLNGALDWAQANMEKVIGNSAKSAGWDLSKCRHYLTETMNYCLEEQDLKGLKKFGELAVQHGVLHRSGIPPSVAGKLSAVSS